jgi:hypothetical protein
MNIKTRQKASKLIAASLLTADWSRRELDELAEALVHSEGFRQETAQLIRELGRLTSQRFSNAAPPSNLFDSDANELFQIIRRSGISQRHLLELISKSAPHVHMVFDKKRLPTQELIEQLFRNYPQETKRILQDLQALPVIDVKKDPYLELIGKRLDH